LDFRTSLPLNRELGNPKLWGKEISPSLLPSGDPSGDPNVVPRQFIKHLAQRNSIFETRYLEGLIFIRVKNDEMNSSSCAAYNHLAGLEPNRIPGTDYLFLIEPPPRNFRKFPQLHSKHCNLIETAYEVVTLLLRRLQALNIPLSSRLINQELLERLD
jgi:hypothetical protein